MTEKLKHYLSNLTAHDLPTGAAALTGIVLLFLVFRTGKLILKVLFFLIAAGLFAGAYWWHAQRG
jgi:hypothetical protein